MCLANFDEYRAYFLNELREKLGDDQDKPECDPIAEAIEIECGALLETVAASRPYQLTGLSMREDYGIVWATSEQDAVDQAQALNRASDVIHALALDPEDVAKGSVQ